MSLMDHYRMAEESFETWKVLEHPGQLTEIVDRSFEKPVAVFKHSVRCGISTHAKYRLENEWGFTPEELDFYYLDLIRHRAISNQIAEDFGVRHQSPQVILIRKGKAVFDASHHMISSALLREALEETR